MNIHCADSSKRRPDEPAGPARSARFRALPACPNLAPMRVTIPALALAVLLASSALPAMAELGPCKADGQDTPLCGSGKGAARVVEDTISPDKKFALAWRHPTMDPGDVTRDEDDGLELLLIRLADGAVLAKADTQYFRNSKGANRRHEFAIWSPDSRMVIRMYDLRYGTDVFTLYRIGADGRLEGQIELDKMIEDAVYARLKKIGRNPEDYDVLISSSGNTLRNNGTLRFKAVAFIVKKDPEVDYDIEMKITTGKAPLRARIVKIVQTHAE
jgi:hypothetical protein